MPLTATSYATDHNRLTFQVTSSNTIQVNVPRCHKVCQSWATLLFLSSSFLLAPSLSCTLLEPSQHIQTGFRRTLLFKMEHWWGKKDEERTEKKNGEREKSFSLPGPIFLCSPSFQASRAILSRPSPPPPGWFGLASTETCHASAEGPSLSHQWSIISLLNPSNIL